MTAAAAGNLRRYLLLPATFRSFSYSTSAAAAAAATSDLASSISSQLTNLAATATSDDLHRDFSLHFSDVSLTPNLLKSVLDLSPTAGRAAVSLFRWSSLRHSPTDLSLSHIINYLGRRRDFKSIDSLLSEFRSTIGSNTLAAAFDRLARAGRPTETLSFYQTFANPRDRSTLYSLLEALSRHGFPGHAERAAKSAANLVFPDSTICEILIRGYCDDLKLADVQRLLGEIERGGFDLNTAMYNSVLDCVCRICRKKDPLRLPIEAGKVLDEMYSRSIPRDSGTFHVLIYNLCKIRKTEDAMKLFRSMSEEWGCSPTADTYLALIKSLYQAARVSEGDEMIGFMRATKFGDLLDRKAYYGFIKILCGIERVDHAIKVLRMMKGYGHAPGVKSYSLLVKKLAEHNQVDRANALFREAKARGVPVEPQPYKVDKRYVKVKEEKKVKKRPTLPEKMKMKRRRLKKLRLSFVKKPRSMRRVI